MSIVHPTNSFGLKGVFARLLQMLRIWTHFREERCTMTKTMHLLNTEMHTNGEHFKCYFYPAITAV